MLEYEMQCPCRLRGPIRNCEGNETASPGPNRTLDLEACIIAWPIKAIFSDFDP